MSFDAIAALISGKRPLWLYEFGRGSARWFFTSARDDVVEPAIFYSRPLFYATDPLFYSRRWHARSISHGRITQAGASYRSELNLQFALSDDFARQFLAPVGIAKTTVTIWHGFLNDPDGQRVIKYKGRIIGGSPSEGGTIDLTCQSELSTLDRKALSGVMQRPCRHALYFGGCGLALADWQLPTPATAIGPSGLNLTVPAAAGAAANYYRGGVVEYAGALELIAAHNGASLTLAAAVPGLADKIAADGSAAIKIAPGCDLSTATCAGVFSNSDNFGGFPFLTDSPFGGGSIL